jgi:class 3 adenylate cyclase
MMRVRHLYQRTRPFRFLGFWVLGGTCLLLTGPVPAVAERTLAQLTVGVGFCALWPWAADRLRALGPAGDASGFEMIAYVAECALASAVLAWVSLPPLASLATAVCLLAGATALAGWRLLVPATMATLLGGWVGAWLSPQLTMTSTAAADGLAMALVLGYALGLAHLSFRQTQRLDAHRRDLAEKSVALERVNDRMRRYLPPSLRTRVTQAPDEPCRWERRWLTVVFVDLVGFTELSERLEAELLASILDEYLAALIPAAERCGGEVSKLLGDGMLVVFGVRGGGDRRTPVDAALGFCGELPELLADLAVRWRDRGEPVALQMRAGIASGFCTLGDRGGADRLDFTLIGSPVNMASRLQAHAGVDGVLLDEASAALAEAAHTLGPRRLLQVKGFGETPAYPWAVGRRVDPIVPSAIVPAPSEQP